MLAISSSDTAVRHRVWGSVELSSHSGDRSRCSSDGSSSRESSSLFSPRDETTREAIRVLPTQAVRSMKSFRKASKAVVEEIQTIHFHSNSNSSSSGSHASFVASTGKTQMQVLKEAPKEYPCSAGPEALACHDQLNGRNKPKPCKDKRDRYKRLIASLGGQDEDTATEATLAAKGLAVQNPFLRTKLWEKLNQAMNARPPLLSPGSLQPQRQLSLQQPLQSTHGASSASSGSNTIYMGPRQGILSL